jgi:hypothetical protein
MEGLRGRPVCRIESASLAAVTSAWAEEPGRSFAREDLLAHHRVVQAITETGACLPVRFATWIASKDAVAALLTERQDELQAALERVRGRKELAVTLLWAEPDEAVSHTAGRELDEHRTTAGQSHSGQRSGAGRRYMEARRRHWADLERKRGRAARWAEQLTRGLACVGVLAEDVHAVVCPAPRVALSCSILVRAESAEAALERVLCVGHAWPDVRVLAHGVWPPYTFARLAP